MRYFRKIVGDRLYLSPFSAEDAEIHFKNGKYTDVVYMDILAREFEA